MKITLCADFLQVARNESAIAWCMEKHQSLQLVYDGLVGSALCGLWIGERQRCSPTNSENTSADGLMWPSAWWPLVSAFALYSTTTRLSFQNVQDLNLSFHVKLSHCTSRCIPDWRTVPAMPAKCKHCDGAFATPNLMREDCPGDNNSGCWNGEVVEMRIEAGRNSRAVVYRVREHPRLPHASDIPQ